MKKIISILLSLSLLLSLISGINVTAFAETFSGNFSDEVAWSFDSDTNELIIEGTGEISGFYASFPWDDINSSITTLRVCNGITGIGGNVFSTCNNLVTVYIPISVQSITGRAFFGCNNIKDVYYEGSLISYNELFDGDFGNDPIKTADIHCSSTVSRGIAGNDAGWIFDSATGKLIITGTGSLYGNDDNAAFSFYEQITSIVVEEGITQISYGSFRNCPNLTAVTLPSTLTRIVEDAFYRCNNIKDVYYNGSRINFFNLFSKYDDHCGNTTLENANIHCENNISTGTCGNDATWVFDDSTKVLTISGTGVIANRTWDDGPGVWGNLRGLIETVIVNEGITGLGTAAFYSCENIKTVNLPSTLTRIRDEAFRGCSNLENIYFNGSRASFYSCFSEDDYSGNSILFEATIHYATNISTGNCGDNASWIFNDETGVLSISGIGNIEYEKWHYTFGNLIKSVIINDGITGIGNGIFDECQNLESVIIANNVTSIGTYAFRDCPKLKNVVLPDNLKEICEGAFSYSKIEEITIPSGIENIKDSAFYSCTNLKTVKIENNSAADHKTNIWGAAFYGCTNLESVVLPKSVKRISLDAFDKDEKVVITGYNSSYAKTYATTLGIPFIAVDTDVPDDTTVKGISSAEIVNGELIIHYTDGTSQNLGKITNTDAPTCNHVWNSGIITKRATCVENGAKTYTCTECGETKVSPIIATGHNYSQKVVKPTCTANGYTEFFCTACSEEYKGDYVKATGHTIVVDKAVAATYTNAGKTEGKHCSSCGSVIVAQKSIAKLTVSAVTLNSVKSSKSKQITVAWKKNTSVTGYEIQYSTSSSFKSAKTVKVTKNSTTSKTISGLSGGKKYYVRIRGYKTYNGKPYYSTWSATKNITVKK